MTAKEYAEELVSKFIPYVDDYGGFADIEKDNAKECALICVEEILDENGLSYTAFCKWKEIQKEINKTL